MTEIRATQGFSLFFAQPKSTYINLLMWIQLQLDLPLYFQTPVIT